MTTSWGPEYQGAHSEGGISQCLVVDGVEPTFYATVWPPEHPTMGELARLIQMLSCATVTHPGISEKLTPQDSHPCLPSQPNPGPEVTSAHIFYST